MTELAGASRGNVDLPKMPNISALYVTDMSITKKYFQVLLDGEKEHGFDYLLVDKANGKIIQSSNFNHKGKTEPFNSDKNHNDYELSVDISKYTKHNYVVREDGHE
jgi:hypothetical protein